MKTFSTKEYESALTAKGFQEERQTGHTLYYLWEEGKKTHIWTKISHGRKEDIRDRLANLIKKQLKFDTKKDLSDFIECPMDHSGYIQYLRAKGEI